MSNRYIINIAQLSTIYGFNSISDFPTFNQGISSPAGYNINGVFVDKTESLCYKYNASTSEYELDTSVIQTVTDDVYPRRILDIESCDSATYADIDQSTIKFRSTMYLVTDGNTSSDQGLVDLYFNNKRVSDIEVIYGTFPSTSDGVFSTTVTLADHTTLDLVENRLYFVIDPDNKNVSHLVIRHGEDTFPVVTPISECYFDETSQTIRIKFNGNDYYNILTLVDGDLPENIKQLIEEYIVTSSGTLFVNYYSDLANIVDKSEDVIYVVRENNRSYRYSLSSNQFIELTSDPTSITNSEIDNIVLVDVIWAESQVF